MPAKPLSFCDYGTERKGGRATHLTGAYAVPGVNLTAATTFLEVNPLSANRPNSRLAADVLSADWLVLDHRWNLWTEPNASQDYGSDAPEKVILEAKFGEEKSTTTR